MAKDYVPPQLDVASYHCPYCNVFAHQKWFQIGHAMANPMGGFRLAEHIEGFKGSQCVRCSQVSFWQESTMIFPTISSAPRPSTDMPEDVAYDFNEAREILAKSPRSSAALLRLALQKLCKHLGQPGKNINDDIGALVKAGLSPKIQQALDIVRVNGNNAVHPGEIDLRDDQDTALALFGLINFIVQEMITRPQELAEMYNKLPAGALKGIAQRDQTP